MARPPVIAAEKKIRTLLSIIAGEVTIAEAGGDMERAVCSVRTGDRYRSCRCPDKRDTGARSP